MERPQFSLAKITAAQATSPIFTYDRDYGQRRLARLQCICASKLARVEAFRSFFNEGQSDIVWHSASHELTIRLPPDRIYSGLRDGLADELHDPEKPVVAAQPNIERNEHEREKYKYSEPAHLVGFHALCAPAGPTTAVLVPSHFTESLASNAV